jgi:hypothetical protein
MRTHLPQQATSVRLPTSNYAFRCDECSVYIELHWLLPKWSDLFPRPSDRTGFPDWAGGDDRVMSSGLDIVFCPRCETLAGCRVVTDGPQSDPPGNYHSTESPDLQWLRRVRECRECGNRFVTAELGEDFIDELVRLRTALADFKRDAELYVAQSQATSESLSRLTRSMGALRSLKVNEAAGPEPGQADF